MSHQFPYRIDPPAPPVQVEALQPIEPDSLGVDSVALDSIAALQPIEPPIEPLPFQPFSDLTLVEDSPTGFYRHVSPEEVFGYSSMQAEIPFIGSRPASLTATPAFSLLVLAIIAFYCLMLYQHLGDAVQLIGRVTRERASGERLSEDSNGDYARFLNLCTTLGILLTGVTVTRMAAPMLHLTPLALWPQSGAFWGAVALAVGLGVVILYQVGVCALVGRLTYTQHLLEQLFILKRTFFALLTIVATPFLALWLLTPAGETNLWFWVIIIELIITLILYLQETLSLFISKKISILHWFLYLCAVEIFPISFLVLWAVR